MIVRPVRSRRAMSTLEAIAVTLIVLVFLVMMYPMVVRSCYVIHLVVTALVGWPYL